MAREGFAALLCATVLVTPLVPYLAPTSAAEPERDDLIGNTLAVQTALREGREHMAAGQYGAAVHVLEQQLPKINGNRAYLTGLRDAYRGYLKELCRTRQLDEARTYLRRLEILDPGARADFPDVGPAEAVAVAPPKAPAPVAVAPPVAPPAPEAAPIKTAAAPRPAGEGKKPDFLARGKFDEPKDPFSPRNSKDDPLPELLARADRMYAGRHWDGAARLYEQAAEVDSGGLPGPAREQWAYCKLFAVKEQFNQWVKKSGTPDGGEADRLEGEVKSAMALAPRVEPFGKKYLAAIQSWRDGPAVAVRHLDQKAGGWAVAEGDNFRVLHHDNRDLAEKVVRAAEKTRRDMGRRWFGDEGAAWKERCTLYLHATAQDYSKATGKPANWTAHSTIKLEETGRVVLRQIDLRCDDPELLTASLPHETTHVVLAGHFGGSQVPRWADEGMAMLSEPRAKLDGYARSLVKARRDGLTFRAGELMTMEEYPEPARAFAFYTQSVSLVDYLVGRPGGAPEFTRFLNDALRTNYESALRKHYNLDAAGLEGRWQAAAFGDGPATQAAFRGAAR